MLRKLLPLLFLTVPATAQADWYEASTDHFVVYSEQRPEKLKEFASELERFDKAIRTLRGVKEEPVGRANRLAVYVVDDRSDVAKLAGNGNVAGFYRSRASGSLAIVPRASGDGSIGDLSPRAILLHEYAHHLMWTLSPHSVYPAWYVEGFAEALGTATFDKDGSVVLGNPPQYRGYVLLSGNALPAEKLFAADTLKLNELQTEGLYGRGWLLVHYTLFGHKRSDQLTAYLTAINAGKSSLEAAAAFGDLRALDRELEQYKKGRFSGLRVKAEAIPIGEVVLRKLGLGEAATMDVRIRSKNGVDEKTAPGVYAAARKAAAPYANDPAAQLVLAEAAFDAGDYSVCETAADRAIAADAKAVRAYAYKAMARMAVANNAKDRTPQTWTAIRRIIVSANRLDPDDPVPLILYYRSFVEASSAPTKIAKDGLARAFELAPQDEGLRFNAASMYLREGNKEMARSLLAPLAYSPHKRGMAEFAAELLKRIDAGDAKGALAALDGEKPEGDGEGGE